jgi:hypothetical protein
MVLYMALYFPDRPSPNSSVDTHRDPVVSVFFIGGVPGFLSAAHYVVILAGGFTEAQISQWMISGFAFSGMLAVGLHRMVQFNSSRCPGSFTHAILRFLCGGAFFSFLGGLPLAFMDYSGAELIGFGNDKGAFFRVLSGAIAVGVCLSFWLGSVLWWCEKRARKNKAILPLMIIAASIMAGICFLPFLNAGLGIFAILYAAIFGIVFAFIVKCNQRKKEKNGTF